MARPAELQRETRERLWAYLVGFGLLAAVLSPTLRHAGNDSYPLSTYPMFARSRPKVSVAFAEGFDVAGGTVRLAPDVVANAEPMQAMHTLQRAVWAGAERRAQLCERIAERVAAEPRYNALIGVRLVEGRFDSVGYFANSREPERRTVHQACAVPRAP